MQALFRRQCIMGLHKNIIIAALFLFLLLPEQNSLYADEIYLKNGDRISGKVIEKNEEDTTVKTQAMGLISIESKFIERIISDKKTELAKPKGKELKLWQAEVSLGYNKSSGNTQTSQLTLGLYGNRKTDHDEVTLKGDSFYSSSNKKMDTQKYSGVLRYAFSFRERRWYNFYKIQDEHDRFANINYRLIPSTGIGYWKFDRPDLKLLFEIGAGFQHTDFRDNTGDTNEAVLIPRMFFEKRLFVKSRFSQDVFFYSSLSDKDEFRMHSETAVTNPINSQLSLRLSLIDDYNSRPPKDTKKNDVRLISSILYNF